MTVAAVLCGGGAAIILVSPELLLPIAIVLLAAWSGIARPDIGIGILAATIPVQEALLLETHGVTLTLTRAVALPLVAGWGVRWLLQRTELRITAPVVAWGLVTFAMAMTLPQAVDRAAWAEEVYRWAISFAVLAIATAEFRNWKSARPLLMGIIVGVGIAAGAGIWQLTTGAGPATFQMRGFTRVYAFFGEPNPLAMYLEFTAPILLAIGISRLRTDRRITWSNFVIGGGAAVGLIMLLLTQSRGGLLGMAAAVLVVGLLSGKRIRVFTLSSLLLFGTIVMFTPQGMALGQRFVSSFTAVDAQAEVTTENWSVQERVAHWRAGITMLEENPLTGVGAGNFNQHFRESTSVWRFRIPRGHAHNSLIQVGAQSGYTGLIPYMVVLFAVGVRLLRAAHQAAAPDEQALAIGALGVLAAVIVHGQFDYLHGLSLNLSLVLAFALAEPALRHARSWATSPDRS